jgi:hypothetical protein
MTKTCALINLAKGVVENMIIASAGDPVEDGYLLVPDPPVYVTLGTKWDGSAFEDTTPPDGKPPTPPGLETL